MEFVKEDEKLNFIEAQFATEPVVNVISKEDFENRINKVFEILWSRLSTSFGPGGAGSFISIYPNYYSTKDGFTIMKNIAFDKKLDQVISDMVMTICSRLNFTVGDGTTTAVIATRSAHKSYLDNKDYFNENFILPRDILKRLDILKNRILSEIDKVATPIRSDDQKELRENIEKIVYISSNGNEELTEMIGSLYEELMYPAISVAIAQDGITKSTITKGYKLDIALTDKLYINNDNGTMLLGGSDILIFDHKVMRETYELILKPLSQECKARGRHLICIAPYYDENALNGIIRQDLNVEYRKENDINLVLMACSRVAGHAKVLLEDLSMLLGTTIISPQIETEVLDTIRENSGNIYSVFNIDDRKIEGLTYAFIADEEQKLLSLGRYIADGKKGFNEAKPEMEIRPGYADVLNLGLKESSFSGFYYDEPTYEKYLKVAKEELEETRKKCEKIGTFSVELNQKQQRVYSLGLKNAIIEVGSTSEISQGYLKDTVDDAVKAAASAYNNGVVLGCNVSTIRIIEKMLCDEIDKLDYTLLKMLLDGYKEVYKTVLMNAFENSNITLENYTGEKPLEVFGTDISSIAKNVYGLFASSAIEEIADGIVKGKTNPMDYLPDNVYDFLISVSSKYNEVFDIASRTFTKDVINSAETDKEILKATIDLLGLLITGNQLVLC